MTDVAADPKLVVLDHPLIHDKLARLRDHTTQPDTFRRIVHEISLLAGYEALRDLPTVDTTVQTPLMEAPAKVLGDPAPAIVGLLRAGLSMIEAVLQLVPEAMVGHIGLYRDHETLQAIQYYFKMPADMPERDVIVLDPMLATGNSAVAALDRIKALQPRSVKFVCLLTCPEGIATVHKAHPDVPIYTAAIDRGLNERGYILPGLGDAGDRIFGTT